VRLKPKPVRRLKKVLEILREAMADRSIKVKGTESYIYVSEVFRVALSEIIACDGMEQGNLSKDWPDSWFETADPTTPPTDRVAEMAAAVTKRHFSELPRLEEDQDDRFERLIREECVRRNIT